MVTLFPTNDGSVIRNADNSSPHYRCDNSAGKAGFTDTFDTLKHVTHINGKSLTDIKQRTQFNPAGTLQAAAFDAGGSMLPIGPWQFGAGWLRNPLGVPNFSSTTEPELFFGVALDL